MDLKLAVIIEALRKLIKPENTTTEDVFYNAGVIDCIKEIEKLALKDTVKSRSNEEADRDSTPRPRSSGGGA